MFCNISIIPLQATAVRRGSAAAFVSRLHETGVMEKSGRVKR